MTRRTRTPVADPTLCAPSPISPAVDIDPALFAGAGLVPAFQPIVELSSGTVVAFEALARWPGVPGVTPGAVFDAARTAGLLAELDWACASAAARAALQADLGRSQALFVNIEPGGIGQCWPHDAQPLIRQVQGGLRVVLELTERGLLDRPARLMRLVEWARGQGFGIALDDVGAGPLTLALLPLLAPDVVKLDAGMLLRFSDGERSRVLSAVMAYVERSGATVIAEGIESPADCERARAFGATLGQGFLFGPAAALAPGPGAGAVPLAGLGRAVPDTPFDLVDPAQGRIGGAKLLSSLSRQLEQRALADDDPPVVLSSFRHGACFTGSTAARYARLAQRCPFVGALGPGMSGTPAPGVRGACLAADDPLNDSWNVVVIGARVAAALIARAVADAGPDDEQRYRFVMTHDRNTVVSAGRSLIRRLMPLSS